MSDLGKRIAAARAYRGLTVRALADALNMTPGGLELLEADCTNLSEIEALAMIEGVAQVALLPAQFFVVDFSSLGPTATEEAK